MQFNNWWQPMHRPLVDADFAWTDERFDNGDRITSSEDRVMSVLATVGELGPWHVALHWHYLGSGPLVEDSSVRSRAAATANLRIEVPLPASWGAGRGSTLKLDGYNLFDRRVDDIQCVCPSQLPVLAAWTGWHLHPAEPRNVRVTAKLAS